MLPLIAVGAMLAGTAYQVYAADELAKASKNASAAEQARLKDIMDQIQRDYQTPSYDATPIQPEDLKLLQKYVPSVAQFTAEQAPHLLTGKGQQQFESIQQDALRQLQARSQGLDDTQFQAQRELASTQAAQDLAAQRQNILRENARRGLGGSGQEILAQMAAAGNAEQMARQESLQGAGQADQRRIAALSQMTGLAGQMRGQAAQQEESNTNIINAFNQRAAVRKQAYDQYQADQQNAANLRNISEQQRLSEANAAARYEAAVRNRDATNRKATVEAEAANRKLGLLTGMGTTIAGSERQGTTDAARAEAGGRAAIGSTVANVGAQAVSSGLSQYLNPTKAPTPPIKEEEPI